MDKHLFDTHFHLDLMESFADTVKEIEENQVYTIAVTNLPVLYSSLKAKLNSKYIKPALGFHPELINEKYKKYIPKMWPLLNNAKYIGEVGLDFKTGSKFKKLQISFFEELILRCSTLGAKILTIHSRMSANEVISIIGNDFNGIAILHWYSGSKSNLERALNNGLYFSINYSMTNSESGRKIIRQIPIERLLLESDSPFVKMENKPFSPKDMRQIVNRISEIKNVDTEKLELELWNNFKKIITP